MAAAISISVQNQSSDSTNDHDDVRRRGEIK